MTMRTKAMHSNQRFYKNWKNGEFQLFGSVPLGNQF